MNSAAASVGLFLVFGAPKSRSRLVSCLAFPQGFRAMLIDPDPQGSKQIIARKIKARRAASAAAIA